MSEFTGKNVQDAIKIGLEQMGLGIDEADIEIVSEGGGGIFGFGAKKAVVRIMPLKDDLANSGIDDDIEDKSFAIKEEKSFAEIVEDKIENNKAEQKAKEKVKEHEKCVNSADNKVTNSTGHIKFITEFLDGLFEKMGVDCSYDIEQKDDVFVVNINSNELGKIIGHRGETLDAIQYLTRIAINKQDLDSCSVIVQTDNYREKREQTLRNLAKRLAAKVVRTGKRVTLEPMKPYERRIIHETLQNNSKVKTDSYGEEPNRYVVIELR